MFGCMCPDRRRVVSYPWVKVEPSTLKDPVPYGTVAPRIRDSIADLPHEIPDELIEEQKPGNRGFMLAQIQAILARCDDGNPEDPRWDELRLRALDRFARLARVYQGDEPKARRGPGDPRILAAAAARILDELEDRRA